MDHTPAPAEDSRPDGFRPVVGAPPPPPPRATALGPHRGVDAGVTAPIPDPAPTRAIPSPDGDLPRAPTPGATGAATARGLLRAARPKQWTKNVLVFAAPGAAGVLFHADPLWHAVVAFVLFSAVASATYLVNDAVDAPADRQHPVKRYRPVADGVISERAAFAAAGVLTAAALVLGGLLRPQLALVLGIYVVLQVAYSTWLKNQPVYDVTCVAGGFLLRAIAGAVAIPVAVSEWFLIVTTFGSLLMVTGKRLAEHTELGEGRGGHRATLDAYSVSFLRIVVAMAATGAVVGYALWAFGLETAAVAVHHHDGIFFQLSIVPVLLALLHFTLLIDQGRGARPEELVLGDRQLQILGAVWVLLFALGVYG